MKVLKTRLLRSFVTHRQNLFLRRNRKDIHLTSYGDSTLFVSAPLRLRVKFRNGRHNTRTGTSERGLHWLREEGGFRIDRMRGRSHPHLLLCPLTKYMAQRFPESGFQVLDLLRVRWSAGLVF